MNNGCGNCDNCEGNENPMIKQFEGLLNQLKAKREIEIKTAKSIFNIPSTCCELCEKTKEEAYTIEVIRSISALETEKGESLLEYCKKCRLGTLNGYKEEQIPTYAPGSYVLKKVPKEDPRQHGSKLREMIEKVRDKTVADMERAYNQQETSLVTQIEGIKRQLEQQQQENFDEYDEF